MIETVGVTLEKEKFECTEEAVGTIVEINNKKKKEAYIGIRRRSRFLTQRIYPAQKRTY